MDDWKQSWYRGWTPSADVLWYYCYSRGLNPDLGRPLAEIYESVKEIVGEYTEVG